MYKTTGTKAATSNLFNLFLGLTQLLLMLLVAANPGFAATSGLALNDSYFFAVTGYDSAGLQSVDFSMVDSTEPTPPAVTMTSPSSNTPGSGIVSVRVSAPEDTGIVKAQFLVNGVPVAETATSPFAFSWDTSALLGGDYVVSVKVFDGADNVAVSDDVTVTVIGDVTPPAVSLAGPANNSTVSGTVVISASANDNVSVTRVEIFVDGTLVIVSDQNHVSYSWNTADAVGNHQISAKAYDSSGNVGTATPIAVTVFKDTTSPKVTIVSPVAGTTASGTVVVSANASDDVAVSKVEFYLNGVLQASPGATSSFNWNTAAIANGSYILSAKAYDMAGNVGQSANVAVNVFNDWNSPTVTAFSMPSSANSITVAVSNFACTDNVAVTGYLITESATAPLASDARWSATAPASFTFAGSGLRTAYAWAKDAAGRVSAGKAATVMIDTILPVIRSMSLASGSSSVTIKVAASDNVAVTRIELHVDGALQLQTAADNLSYVWTAGVKKSQGITVKVYDAAGNVRSQSFRVSKI